MVPIRKLLDTLWLVLLTTTPLVVSAATIQVNDSGDALHEGGCAATGVGTCTLRDAITFANLNPGNDSIVATAGLQPIAPTAPLPAIVDSVYLDGRGYAFSIVGSSAGAHTHGLVLDASDSAIQGLAIEGFSRSGLKVSGSRNDLGRNNMFILGYSTGAGNLIQNNGGHGIEIVGGSDNNIFNNAIVGNQGAGIYLAEGAARNRIGGLSQIYGLFMDVTYFRNLIWRNAGPGIQVGRDVADTQTIGNRADFNSFQGNRGLDIDLAGDGIVNNDPDDLDSGPNLLQNAPVVTIAWNGSTYRVDGTLHTTANTAFQAFGHSSQQTLDAIANLGGQTDAAGNASFSFGVPTGAGCSIEVAVATSAGTSEFSATVVAPSPPSDAPLAPRFHLVEPCRLVDTRGPVSPLGGPALSSGVPRSFDLDESCGVPATAKVLSVNLTATGPTGAGFVSFGVGVCPEVSTSSVNFAVGQTRANNALLNLDALGNATVTALVAGRGTVDLIVDVNGYFE